MKYFLFLVTLLSSIIHIHNAMAETDQAEEKTEPLSIAFVNENIELTHPSDGPVIYQGVVSYDEAGTGELAMMYPAADTGSFIAALVTHGLLTKSARKKQKEKIQSAANEVLTNYEGVLNNFTHKDLMERAAQKLSTLFDTNTNEQSPYSNDQLVINIKPNFLITQDEKAIIINDSLDVKIKGSSDILYKNNIKVVSDSLEDSESLSFWTDSDGENLKDLSAELLAKSIELTLKDMSNKTPATEIPFKTIRYQQGATEKIERAKVIDKNCDRMVIKNLRGTLMSVPIALSKKENCTFITKNN